MEKKYNKTNKLPIILALVLCCFACEDNGELFNAETSGQAGSLARFAVSGNNLYVVDDNDLKFFDITDPTNPGSEGYINIGFGIETIFPRGNNLFIGSRTGMHIYDISTPTNPTKLSVYRHVTACDPVVVQGNYAYVTIRDGVDCRFGENLLDVVDISNLVDPQVVASYPMYNPHGLSIDGPSLFVCEGEQGLRTIDAGDPLNLVFKEEVTGFHGYDVITNNGNLIVIGNDGLYQYHYSNAEKISFLSKITVE